MVHNKFFKDYKSIIWILDKIKHQRESCIAENEHKKIFLILFPNHIVEEFILSDETAVLNMIELEVLAQQIVIINEHI